MAAKILERVKTLCHGCLSADRDLSPIGEFSEVFSLICDRKAHVLAMKDINLCWECIATLKRMQLFQKQVYIAQSILGFYVRTQNNTLPKSLSKLKATRTNHDFISLTEPVKLEPEFKPLFEVKEEIFSDENEDININDFLYVESKVELESETIVNVKVNNVKTKAEYKDTKPNKNIKRKLRYIHISTPDEMCVKEQARQSDLVNLWEGDKYTAKDSKVTSETPEEMGSYETVYRCLVCGYRSPRVEAAGRHVTQHGEIVKCRLCEYCSEHVDIVRAHYMMAHKEFSCDHCEKIFKSKRAIEGHLVKNHRDIYPCEQCNRSYRTRKRLTYHIRSEHKTKEPDEEAYCVPCNKTFKNRARYIRHQKWTLAHEKEGGRGYCYNGRIKCLACEKSYTKRQAMLDHYQLKHLGTSKYYCKDCKVYYVSASTLNTHRRIHHEGGLPRNKICDVCGRGFTRNAHLVNHMRRHTGERPFACALCSMRFAQKVARDAHQTRHAKQKHK